MGWGREGREEEKKKARKRRQERKGDEASDTDVASRA